MTATAPGLVRLSLRELREIPYRAFRVAGASHGEALHAAEAVQFAEVNGEGGIAAAVSSATAGWAVDGLTPTRTRGPESIVFDIGSAGPVDLLQMGAALVELASCTDLPATVRLRASEMNATIDHALCLAAVRTGRTAFAAQQAGSQVRVRAATPEGDLGQDLREGTEGLLEGLEEGGTVIATSRLAASALIRADTRRPAAAFALHRADAARNGVNVDDESWTAILRLASGYKQPDKEKS